MATATGIVKIGFYLGKLFLTAIWTLPYLRWQMWRAKHAFAKELQRGGLPDELIESLVESYNRQNKQVIGLITRGFTSLRRRSGGEPHAAIRVARTDQRAQ